MPQHSLSWTGLQHAACGILLIWALVATAPGATLSVNTSNDENLNNGTLSLYEAMALARGDMTRSLSTGEKNRISGANFIETPPFSGIWFVNPINPGVGQNVADQIVFDSGVGTIATVFSLGVLGRNDSINGDRGGGAKVVINGSGAGSTDGIRVEDPNEAASANTIENLVVRNFQGAGIVLIGGQGCTLRGLELFNNGDGLVLGSFVNPNVNSRNNTIGGTGTTGRNYIHNNQQDGIRIFGNTGDGDTSALNNLIRNCYIGLKDATGDSDQGNFRNGIYFSNAWGNTIDGCVVSGNNNDGIKLEFAGSHGNTIKNCVVGLNPGRTIRLGNGASGIALVGGGPAQNSIGSPAEPNTIGANPIGIYLQGSQNTVADNYVGTNAALATGLGNIHQGIYVLGNSNAIGVAGIGNTICRNRVGIEMRASSNTVKSNYIGTSSGQAGGLGNTEQNLLIAGGAQQNVIGGNSGEGNLIMGAGQQGVLIVDSTTMVNKLQSNTIGGSGALGNAGEGVRIWNAPSNEIGAAFGNGNVIAGNGNDGIKIDGPDAAGNLIFANTIGLNAARTAAVPNTFSGVALLGGAHDNLVGGTSALSANVIAGNAAVGVFLANAGTKDNDVLGNFIGTTPSGAPGLGNAWHGVAIYDGATNNAIGSTATNAGNTISGNAGVGIDLANAGTSNNTMEANRIGVTPSGTVALGNAGGGIRIFGAAANNTIGGTADSSRNIISGNAGPGVGIYNTGSTGNVVRRNYIGLNAAGSAALGNQMHGVVIQEGAALNSIRENFISGNAQCGIAVNHSGSNQNTLAGNKIGVNAAGTAAIGNASHGILINGGPQNNVIGGSSPYNIISGNGGDGVRLTGAGTTGNHVTFNVVGLDLNGSAKIPNLGHGIAVLDSAGGCIIGDVFFFLAANYIAGNAGNGILIAGAGVTGVDVRGNCIGGGPTPAAGQGNTLAGVLVTSGATQIDIGDAGQQANIIVGNGGAGIELNNAPQARVRNNYIGILPATDTALPNADEGVLVSNGSTLVEIGGSQTTVGNWISGNAKAGISLTDPSTTTATLRNNRIGVNVAGTGTIGNGGDGIAMLEGAGHLVDSNIIAGNTGSGLAASFVSRVQVLNNRIGLLANDAPAGNAKQGVLMTTALDSVIGGIGSVGSNLIAYNTQDGVRLMATGNRGDLGCQRITIRGNAIYLNGGLGLDLTGDGPSLNDLGDADVGNNERMNYPELYAVRGGTTTPIEGRLFSRPNSTCIIDFYASPNSDPSGFGEGQVWLAQLPVITDASGLVEFAHLAPGIPVGWRVTATATSPSGSTSEFSRALRNPVEQARWTRYE